MEDISITALWLAIIGSGASSLLYWAHLLGLRLVIRRVPALSFVEGVTERGHGGGLAALDAGDSGSGWTEQAGRLAAPAAWAAAAFLALSLLARWQAVDHAPWSNMYEFTVALAAAVMASCLTFQLHWLRDNGRAASSLGAVVLPVVLAMLVLAAIAFPSDVRPLVPALQNTDLLTIHVAAMVLAYGALSISFASAVLYLMQGGNRNRFSRLPRAPVLDDIAYRSVMLGFPLLTVGIALGAYWANSAWGRYWGWDPKETAALMTWLIYGIYLHTRGLRGWAGTRSVVVLVVGFAAVLFTYFAVNLWVSGLHSYAGV